MYSAIFRIYTCYFFHQNFNNEMDELLYIISLIEFFFEIIYQAVIRVKLENKVTKRAFQRDKVAYSC